MSLLEPGPGILSTYVTVDEIQKAVQRVFGDSAKFGEAASFTNIGVGNGFMSRIVLVDPNWKAKPLFAPAKFILKLPSLMTMLDCSKLTANPDVSPELMQSMMASFEAQLRRLHNTEITVYDWMRTYKPKVPSCEVYFSKAFDGVADLKGVFVMQYIDNTVRSIVYDNVTLAQIEAPLRALASFEAMGRKVPEAEREKITSEPFRRIFADLIAEPAITAMINMMETSFPGRMTDLLAKLREYLLEILDIDFVESIPERLGMERVLTHGDLWANNMLFQRKEDGSADLAAVIDFQTSHWGCAVTDLARLFNACLSGDDRRQHWERLVETFYGFLQEELVGQKMPYTLEQLKTAYREYFPFGGIMVAPMVPGMVPILVSDPESPEYKKLMEKAYSKSEAMIADIITQHEENKKNRVQ